MTELKPSHQRLLDDFERHLKTGKAAPRSVCNYLRMLEKFLLHVGDIGIDRISEDLTRSYFAGIKNATERELSANIVRRFLRFTAGRLPVVVSSAAAPKSTKEIAHRARWTLDKLAEQKNRDDDLIAKLARKVIDHYLYFQGRMKGQPENLDDVYRFADECRELIEGNLPLFMQLSAGGRNIHSKIDERVQL